MWKSTQKIRKNTKLQIRWVPLKRGRLVAFKPRLLTFKVHLSILPHQCFAWRLEMYHNARFSFWPFLASTFQRFATLFRCSIKYFWIWPRPNSSFACKVIKSSWRKIARWLNWRWSGNSGENIEANSQLLNGRGRCRERWYKYSLKKK